MEIRINLTSFQINFRSKDVSFRYVYILDIKILISEAQITKECWTYYSILKSYVRGEVTNRLPLAIICSIYYLTSVSVELAVEDHRFLSVVSQLEMQVSLLMQCLVLQWRLETARPRSFPLRAVLI